MNKKIFINSSIDTFLLYLNEAKRHYELKILGNIHGCSVRKLIWDNKVVMETMYQNKNKYYLISYSFEKENEPKSWSIFTVSPDNYNYSFGNWPSDF